VCAAACLLVFATRFPHCRDHVEWGKYIFLKVTGACRRASGCVGSQGSDWSLGKRIGLSRPAFDAVGSIDHEPWC
jgi:hypothetical protein